MNQWSKEELEYLRDKWGTSSIQSLSKKLNRTTTAVRLKASRLKLGNMLLSSDKITLNALSNAIFGTDMSSDRLKKFKKLNLPMENQRVVNSFVRVIEINDFWNWAEKNQNALNFVKFEENSLGVEPHWVKTKRASDINFKNQICKIHWTKYDDERLTKYLSLYKYNMSELSIILNRTSGAIQRRICDLKLKDRPNPVPNHTRWTDEEITILEKMIYANKKYQEMSTAIKKGEKAIRGYVFRLYGSENLDKVKEILSKRCRKEA